MQYPYTFLRNAIDIYPVLGKEFTSAPHVFDYSSSNPLWSDVDVRDVDTMQHILNEELAKHDANWGIAGYLEDRSARLKGTFLYDIGRIYHLGVDIIVSAGAKVHTPLSGVIENAGYESGKGNYGGYSIVKHTGYGDTFYSLYGHLNKETLLKVGSEVSAGDVIGEVGMKEQNGNWTEHIHMQIISEQGKREDWFFKGYCTYDDIPTIGERCPNPLFMLRYTG